MKETDKARAAGWLDGEGTILLAPSGRTHALHVSIANGDRRVIRWLHKLWPEGYVLKVQQRGNRYVSYRFGIASNAAVEFLNDVFPYLICKKEQANIGIGFQKCKHKQGHNVRLTTKELRVRNSYVRRLKQARFAKYTRGDT
jgi:hypothetical protein